MCPLDASPDSKNPRPPRSERRRPSFYTHPYSLICIIAFLYARPLTAAQEWQTSLRCSHYVVDVRDALDYDTKSARAPSRLSAKQSPSAHNAPRAAHFAPEIEERMWAAGCCCCCCGNIYMMIIRRPGAECIAVLIQTDCTKHDGNGPEGVVRVALFDFWHGLTKFKKRIGLFLLQGLFWGQVCKQFQYLGVFVWIR